MRRKATVLALALLLAACSRDNTLEPVGFPTCTPVPQPTIAPVEGLIVPPGSHVYRAQRTGQKLRSVKGYVDMDPVAIRKFYASLQGKPDIEFFFLEDEVIEAEAFFTNGDWRNYVRARTICEGRSQLFILVAPEDYAKDFNVQPRTASPSPNV